MSSREGKTEAPTPKKKQDAKKKGTVSKSADLGPWLSLLIATYFVPWLIVSVGRGLVDLMASLGDLAQRPDPTAVPQVLGQALRAGFTAALPFLLALMLLAVTTTMAQTGLVLSLHPLKPDFRRIDPIKGTKRLLSAKSLWETGKQIVKAVVIAWLAWPYVLAVHEHLIGSGRMALRPAVSVLSADLVAMARKIAWAGVTIGLVDYVYQRRSKLRDLRMTKQEVRDEMRMMEGDPMVKSRIRSLQMALGRNRMMSAVAEASVVVTNPTHIAVAIAYDPAKGAAPRVVAIGTDATAARIREKAMEARVPIVEAKPLARALWRSCELGDEIPVVLYEAVAKVLAFVRRLRSTMLPASATPLPNSYRVSQQVLDAVPDRQRGRRRGPARRAAA
jgi:flagellar biosynthetic protein FlhB